MLKDF